MKIPQTFIILNLEGWNNYCSTVSSTPKYAAPESFPVLVQVKTDGIPVLDIETAINFIGELDASDMTDISFDKLQKAFSILNHAGLAALQAKVNKDPVNKYVNIKLDNGLDYKFTSDAVFHLGDKVTINGEQGTVVNIKEKEEKTSLFPPQIQIPTASPLVVDVSTLVGVTAIPMDPGKIELSPSIAQMPNPTEHVLDIERDI